MEDRRHRPQLQVVLRLKMRARARGSGVADGLCPRPLQERRRSAAAARVRDCEAETPEAPEMARAAR